MKEFFFEFHEEKKTGDIVKNTMTIESNTFEEAKMIINTRLLISNPRAVFDWFPSQEENTFVGMKVYC